MIPFLNARLDEDEAAARRGEEVFFEGWPDRTTYDSPELDDANRYLTRFSPARVLREVAARRARLALMIEAIEEMDRLIADDDAATADQAMAIGRCRAATVAVKYDAAIYRDHPDYRQKWAL